MAEKKLFGTDGIRGVAGEPPLDPQTIFIAGICLGNHLRGKNPQPRVIIGEDPRESSRWIAQTIAAGLKEAGAEILPVGVLTTPGLAYLSKAGHYDAGVMISASHNPYLDNGIKVFASTGYKLPDEEELQVEHEIFRLLSSDSRLTSRKLALVPDREPLREYISFLRRAFGANHNLDGRKLLLDCANGSASTLAAEVFSGLGMKVNMLSAQPDGRNINLHCGSMHLETLQHAILEQGGDLGIAFDGDADRALFVTGTGEVVNGDGVLLAAGRYLKQRGTLGCDAVVGTVMSNLGLEHALAGEGLQLLRTPVGDKYVLEEMLRCGANLGGEQSGHIIFRSLATTGDGLLTALQMLRIMSDEEKTLDQLLDGLKIFPQTIRNVRVREKIPFDHVPQILEQIRASEKHLGSSGRVLVRYSGTEPLARVMVEAATPEDVELNASAIVSAIEQSIGATATAKA